MNYATLEAALKRIEELEAENKALKEKIEKPLTWDLPGYYITPGTRKNALEIYFEAMPGTGIIKQLKEVLKMRWNPKKKCWYGFATHNEITFILQDPTKETAKEADPEMKTDENGFIDPTSFEDPFEFVA